MARTSRIVKDKQRRETVTRYAERRAAVKAVLRNPNATAEEKAEASAALQRMPRDASPTRLRNRDSSDGRPRGYLRAFGLSRITMREMAHRGELPGVRTSSW